MNKALNRAKAAVECKMSAESSAMIIEEWRTVENFVSRKESQLKKMEWFNYIQLIDWL